MSILVVSDTHISSRLWGGPCDDSVKALYQVADIAKARGATSVVIAGDLLDCKNPDSASVFAVTEFDRRLSGVAKYAIPGQHDRSDPQWYDFAFITDLENTLAHIEGFDFYGIGHHYPVDFPHVFDQIPESASFVVGHNLCFEALRVAGDFHLDDLLSRMPLGATALFGDMHTPWVSPEGRFWHIGATHPRAVDDLFSPRVLLVDDEGGIESIPLKCRKILSLSLGSQIEMDKMLAQTDWDGDGYPPVLRIECGGGLDPKLVEKAIRDRAPGARPFCTRQRLDWGGEGRKRVEARTDREALDAAYTKHGVDDETIRRALDQIYEGEDIVPAFDSEFQGIMEDATHDDSVDDT